MWTDLDHKVAFGLLAFIAWVGSAYVLFVSFGLISLKFKKPLQREGSHEDSR